MQSSTSLFLSRAGHRQRLALFGYVGLTQDNAVQNKVRQYSVIGHAKFVKHSSHVSLLVVVYHAGDGYYNYCLKL